ncbi:MAG: phosphate ABC transporter substrate-binding protein [Thermodesulfobacteriota bacterium]
MKRFSKMLSVAAGLGLLAAGLAAPAAAEDIVITGSTTVLPIAQKAAEVYMGKNPSVRISVAGTGSGDGIKAIIDGTADIGNSSRDMKGKEEELAQSKGVKPVRHVVALDCIVPVVHPSNPVKDLSLMQLKQIYTGKIKNWKEVGGEDKTIVVVSRDSSSGTFEVWNEMVLMKERVRPDAQLQASNGAVAQAVAGNKNALGYVGIGYLNPDIKALTVGGVAASAETAKSKAYPVARGLNMYTNGTPKGAVKDFIDFVLGAEGQQMVKKEKFVPVN